MKLDETYRNTLQEKDSSIMMSCNTPSIEQTNGAIELSFFSMDIQFSSRLSLICGAWVQWLGMPPTDGATSFLLFLECMSRLQSAKRSVSIFRLG